jgi:hypothetical protein
LNKEDLAKLIPKRLSWRCDDPHHPGSKVEETAPIQGSERVHNIVGFARIDLLARKMTKIQLMNPLPQCSIVQLTLSKSGEKIFSLGIGGQRFDPIYGSVVRIDDFSIETEWALPDDLVLASLLDEGRKAIVIQTPKSRKDEDPQKLLLLEW